MDIDGMARRAAVARESRTRNVIVQVLASLSCIAAMVNLLFLGEHERVFIALIMFAVAVNALNSSYQAYLYGDVRQSVLFALAATFVAVPVLQLLFGLPWQFGLAYVLLVAAGGLGFIFWDTLHTAKDIREWQAEMQGRAGK